MWLRHRTSDSVVVSLSPSHHAVNKQPWTSYLHPCAFVIRQYNLVPAKARV